jgi:hypothetical protein
MTFTKKKTSPKPALKAQTKIKVAPTPKSETVITEALKNKVFPYIVNDFIHALQDLATNDSLRFGKLGSFKKLLWKGKVNGKQYQSIRYKFKPYQELKKHD